MASKERFGDIVNTPLNRAEFDSLQAAVDAVTTTGAIYVPPGEWIEPARVTVPSNKHITLYGNGAETSVLRWIGPNGGLKISSAGEPQKTLTIKDLSFETAVPNGGTAIETKHEIGSASIWKTLNLSGILVRPVNAGGAFWNRGFVLDGAYNAHLNGLQFVGLNGTFDSEFGILFRGKSVDVHILGFHAFYVDTAIGVDSVGDAISEGVNVTAGKLVAVNTGLNIPVKGAGLTLCGIHILAYKAGVVMTGRGNAELTGLTIFQSGGIDNFRGIDANGLYYARILGNNIVATSTSGTGKNGIVISDAELSVISANVISGMDAAIWLKPNVRHCVVKDNIGYTIGESKTVLDQGTGNLVADNPRF